MRQMMDISVLGTHRGWIGRTLELLGTPQAREDHVGGQLLGPERDHPMMEVSELLGGVLSSPAERIQ